MSPPRFAALSTAIALCAGISPQLVYAEGAAEKKDAAAATVIADEDQTAPPSLLATAAAIIPGIALHGLGHYVAGDKKTAYALLRWQTIGLAMAASAGAFLYFSGGSRRANELTIPVLVSGSGLFINTFIADIYGSASGGSTRAFRANAAQAASLSYAYIYDPLFAYRNFTLAEARFTIGNTKIEPRLWTAVDANNQRARLPVQHALIRNDNGERLSVSGALVYHHFGDDGFTTYVAEASLEVRIAMRRLGDSLRGSFATMSVGGGMQYLQYDGAIENDASRLLLGSFGYGFALPYSGEIEAYYEHRRDTFSAGLSPGARNGSGFLGHFGVRLRQPLTERFALRAQSEIGAAWIASLGLEVNLEARP